MDTGRHWAVPELRRFLVIPDFSLYVYVITYNNADNFGTFVQTLL